MDIYDYMKCNLCKETYFGHFKSDIYGNVSCIDCENKEVLSERLKIDNKQPKESYEQVMVLDMLERDLGELYPLVSGVSEIPLHNFMSEDGNLILEKVYFQGNDLDFVSKVQQKAYSCLKYLDTNEIKYSSLAKDVIKRYLELREHKLSESENKDFINTLESDDFIDMEKNL